MEGFEIIDRRFARYILPNAPLEELASGFRWIEGLVWMADASCLLVPGPAAQSNHALDRGCWRLGLSLPLGLCERADPRPAGRLFLLASGRCLYRTEPDGHVTKLVAGTRQRLNAPNDVVVKSDETIWFSDPLYGIQTDYEGGRQTSEQPPALYRL